LSLILRASGLNHLLNIDFLAAITLKGVDPLLYLGPKMLDAFDVRNKVFGDALLRRFG
jgi:hypothetical protein